MLDVITILLYKATKFFMPLLVGQHSIFVSAVNSRRRISMSVMEPLCCLFGVNPNFLTQEEKTLLEGELIVRICDELKEIFREEYKNYFCLINFTLEKENFMLESTFIQSIIKDIVSSKEYNLQGIAYYTDSFEEVIEDFMIGCNTAPSVIFFCKLVNLHRSVRPDIYNSIIQKIIARYLTSEERGDDDGDD